MVTEQDFNSLKRTMQRNATSVHGYLRTFYDEKVDEARAKDVDTAKSTELTREFMLRPGKCVQSFVAWNAYKLAGGTEDDAILPVLGALETNHYFLLNIDDMIDRDVIRHGGPTVEVMFKRLHTQIPEDQADHMARSFSEIASANMYGYAMEMIAKSGLSPEMIATILPIMIKNMLQDTAVGWEIHILQNFEELKDADEERFLKGLKYVTSYYKFVGPSHIGLVMAGASEPYKSALTLYGEFVGTAFQVFDDVLGLFGNPAVTGKSAGNDVREGKKTLLLQHAYKNGSEEERAFLNAVVGTELSEEDLARVRQIVERTGSLEYAKQRARELMEAGVAAILPIKTEKNAEYIDNLVQLAQFVVNRDK